MRFNRKIMQFLCCGLVMMLCHQLHAGDVIAQWTMQEGLARETVSGNEFKPRPGLPLVPVDGPGDTAAYFVEGQYLVGKMPAELKPPFTLEITCMPAGHALGAVGGLFEWMNHSRNGFRVGLQRNGQALFLIQGNGKEHYVRSKSEIDPGKWTHIAYAVHSDKVEIYINGKLDQSQAMPVPFTPAPITTLACIGKYSGIGGTFNGVIGKVRITDGIVSSFANSVEPVFVANRDTKPSSLLPEPKAITPLPVSGVWLKENLIFSLRFNGDVSATTPAGVVEALDVNPFNLDQGQLVDGVVGQALDIKRYKFIKYPAPANFPPQKGGTISYWFKTGDWFSADARAFLEKNDYARKKTVFRFDPAKDGKWGPWESEIRIDGDPADHNVIVHAQLGSPFGLYVKTKLDIDAWHHVCATWGPDGGDPKLVRASLYLDGKLVDEALNSAMPANAIGENFYISNTNPGVTYSGALDELFILASPVTPEQIGGLFKAPGQTE